MIDAAAASLTGCINTPIGLYLYLYNSELLKAFVQAVHETLSMLSRAKSQAMDMWRDMHHVLEAVQRSQLCYRVSLRSINFSEVQPGVQIHLSHFLGLVDERAAHLASLPRCPAVCPSQQRLLHIYTYLMHGIVCPGRGFQEQIK